MSSLNLRSLLKKTIFLVALATVRRVGEIQALSHKISRKGHDIYVSYTPNFVAKTENAANPLPRSFALRSLRGLANDYDSEKPLCPVRALSWYLDRTKVAQGRPDSLFLSIRNPSRPISKNAISFFIRELILEAEAVVEGDPRLPRAHSVRSAGTSAAFLKNVSLDKILSAACWKSSSVFTSSYLRDFQFERENCHSLGPFVASGQVLSFPFSSSGVGATGGGDR